MLIFHSVPVMILSGAAVILALLSRRGFFPRATAYLGTLAAAVLAVLILVEGGTLYEALACLLLPLWLLPAREAAP